MRLFSLLMLCSLILSGQENTSRQIWGNLVLGSAHNDKVYLELDIEPKTQTAGTLTWHNVDMTPLIEYYPNRWIDLTAEAVMGYTKDSLRIKTYEISPRIGVRFHILGNIRQYIPNDNILSFERFSFSTLIRYEYRNLYYDNGNAEHQSRFRVRIETKTAINHKKYSEENTFYLFADVEKYFNIGEDIHELFHHKTRVRIGPGYTYDKKHRFELLFIYDYAYDTTYKERRHDATIIDFRYKLYF